jgi:nucleotide-binding universal stress UspA family protein
MVNRSTHLGIVVGVDGSPGSMIAVQWAAQDAALRGVPLTLVHAARTRSQRERGQQVLDEARRIAGEKPRVQCEMPSATAVFALTDLSEHADLVVVGCLGTGTLRGRHLCSVSSTLIHHAHCPVVVIHDDVQLNPESNTAPVLVGIDGSPESELAIAIAFEEASARKVGLTAVHAWQPVNVFDDNVFDDIVSFAGEGYLTLRAREDEIMSERLAGWSERYPDVTVQRVVARNDPTPQLIDYAKTAQLVVVGSHGSGGLAAMLLGSVSAGVVLLTHVPIIVARASLAGAR